MPTGYWLLDSMNSPYALYVSMPWLMICLIRLRTWQIDYSAWDIKSERKHGSSRPSPQNPNSCLGHLSPYPQGRGEKLS